MTLTVAAIGPDAVATKEYSPSRRHVAFATVTGGWSRGTLHGVVVPRVKRGSNAHDPPGAISTGATKVCVGAGIGSAGTVPAIAVNVSVGRTAASPTFCTTMVLTRPTPLAFFAAYGP